MSVSWNFQSLVKSDAAHGGEKSDGVAPSSPSDGQFDGFYFNVVSPHSEEVGLIENSPPSAGEMKPDAPSADETGLDASISSVPDAGSDDVVQSQDDFEIVVHPSPSSDVIISNKRPVRAKRPSRKAQENSE